MFDKFKVRCRDECCNNMIKLSEDIQTSTEYLDIAIKNENKENVDRWLQTLTNQIGEYRASLMLFRWLL
jgi:hypothetical protein